MLKKLTIISLLCLWEVALMNAQTVRVSADDINAYSQSTITNAILPISLHSEMDATGLQLDLHLPTGISFASVAKGAISTASHVVTSSKKGDFTRIVLYSSRNEVFSAKEGKVLNVSLNIDTALISKSYDIQLKNILVSDASSPAVRYSVSDQHAAIAVTTLAERIVLSDIFTEQNVGTVKALSASVYPAYTTNKQVSWKSLSEAVASVDSTGKVTFVGKGVTDIVASTLDGSGLSSECHVYSGCSMIHADSIKAHSQTSVQAVVLPVKYQSNSDNTATQFDLYLPAGFSIRSVQKGDVLGQSHVVTSTNKDGHTRFVCYSTKNDVFAKKEGRLVEITLAVDTALASKDYDVQLKNIFVSDASTPAVRYSIGDQHAVISVTTHAEKILLSNVFIEQQKGTYKNLTAGVYPAYATNKQVSWKSLNEAVASVDSTGKVTFAGKGITDIVASTLDGSGLSSACHIYSDCSMLYADSIKAHSQSTVQTAVLPVKYQSNSDNIATQFDLYLPAGFSVRSVQKGDILGQSHVVTEIQNDGSSRFVCNSPNNIAFVKQKGTLAEIILEVDTALMSKNYDVLLKNILVFDASSPTVSYSVSDQHTAIAVTTLAERIVLSDMFTEQNIGAVKALSASVSPAYTTNKQVSWKSLNEAVACVDSTGKVTFVGKGITDVVATTLDGSNLSSACHVYSDGPMVYVDSIKAHSQSIVQTAMLPVKYQSNSDNTATQFDLYLPTGFSIRSVQKGDVLGLSHAVTSTNKDGYTRFVCYSTKNDVFAKKQGKLVEITLAIDTALASKNYDVQLKNIFVSDASTPAVRYSVGDQQAVIAVTTLAEKIAFNSDCSLLPINQENFLSPIIYPAYTTKKDLEWNVEDSSIVKINNGVVQAVGKGIGRITANTLDGSGVSATHIVYVDCSMVYTDNLHLYSQSNKLVYDIPIKLNAFVEVSNFQTDILLPKGITIVSAKKGDIATDSHVVNVAADANSTRILCYSHKNEVFKSKEGVVLNIMFQVDSALTNDDYDVVFTKTHVSTSSMPSKRYDIPDWHFSLGISTLAESIAIDKKSIEILDGESEQLHAQILPLFVSDNRLKWISQNPDIAIVDDDGMVQGKGDGITKIIVVSTDGSNISDTCIVKVNPVLAHKITLSEKIVRLEDKQNAQLSYSLFPENVTHKKAKWTSDDASVVTVDTMGLIHACQVGQTMIWVKTTDGTELTDSCMIIVSPLLVTNLKLESDTINVGIGSDQSITALVEPEDATDKSLIWESSDNSVVTVNEYGRITTLKAGQATITATSLSNSSAKATCVVNVHPITTRLTARASDDNTIILEWTVLYNKYPISDYNVYVSENDQPFVLWLPNINATSAIFKITDNTKYRFLVKAKDVLGNIERYDETKCIIYTIKAEQ